MDAIRLKIHDSKVPPQTSKLWGLDLVRTFAALGVVTLHACVPYSLRPMPGLLWVTSDQSPSPQQGFVIDLMLWSIEIMIMPLFLVMSGFLLWRSLRNLPQRESSSGDPQAKQVSLIRDRAKRLLLPLMFGVLVVLPFDLYLWTIGLFCDGKVPAIKLKSFAFSGTIEEQIWGPAHLWFLPYLFSYIVIAYACFQGIGRLKRSPAYRLKISPVAIPCALVALATFTLWRSIQVVWGFQNSFVPIPSKWIYSGLFFSAGIWLYQADPKLKHTTCHTFRLLSIGMVLLAATLALGFWHLDSQSAGDSTNHVATALLAGLTVGSACMLTSGLLGLGNRFGQHRSSFFSYCSAASLWVYVIHLPILCLIQFDLKQWWPAGPAIVKLAVSLGLTVLLSLITYQFFVRRTAFGRLFRFANESDRRQTPPRENCEHLVEPEVAALPSRIAA